MHTSKKVPQNAWKDGGRATSKFVCVHRRKKYHTMHNGHNGDHQRQTCHCPFSGFRKAFELANPAAILETLVDKRVEGKNLHWIKNNIGKKSRVKFQWVISDYKQLNNKTSQEEILSPFLFKVLMENLTKLALHRNAKIFILEMT